MATVFLLVCAILGLYSLAASARNGSLHLVVPSTSGYLCDEIFFNTIFLKGEAEKAYKRFTHQSFQKAFPALFEDLYLFNKYNEILLAWPILFPWASYDDEPNADYRLIIDSNGEVIGMVTVIYPKEKSHQLEFRKCKPTHSFNGGDDDTSRLQAKQLEETYPLAGYLCDGAFLNKRSFSYTIGYLEKSKTSSKSISAYEKKISKYSGNEFSGDNLLGFPLRNLDSNNNPNGPIKTHRIIFHRNKDGSILVKGIVSKDKSQKDDGQICPSLWDLSSLSQISPDVSSPISRKMALVNNDGTFTCAKQELNISTILLQVPFSLHQAQISVEASDEKYPILQSGNLWLWPVIFPESYLRRSTHVFAIGCDLKFQVVGLFYTRNTRVKNPIFKQCLNT